MKGATDEPPPKTISTPMSSKTKTMGVIHQAFRCQRKLKRSFKKSMTIQFSNSKSENTSIFPFFDGFEGVKMQKKS